MDKLAAKTITLVEKTKKVVTIVLLLLMLFIVMVSVVELAIIVFREAVDPRSGELLFDINELYGLFGFFFIILIGIELLETIEIYIKKNVIHVEIVLMVAVIAMSRKIVLLDQQTYEAWEVIGFSAVIVALGLCYFLIKRSNRG